MYRKFYLLKRIFPFPPLFEPIYYKVIFHEGVEVLNDESFFNGLSEANEDAHPASKRAIFSVCAY